MNKELLLKVNDWVQQENVKLQTGDEPSEWRQRTWACATTCCFAGKVVLEAGGVFVNITTGTPISGGSTASCLLNGKVDSIRRIAVRILDITMAQGDILFSADNGAEDINRIVHDLVDSQ